MSEDISTAERACRHIVRLIQSDGRLAYLIGPFSETYELVTEAAAPTWGMSVEELRRSIEPNISKALAERESV